MGTEIVRPDFDRFERTGIPEVIFCEGKEPTQPAIIFMQFIESVGYAFATRANDEHKDAILASCPEAVWNKSARTLRYGIVGREHDGYVAIATGGTSDIPVAEEAAETLSFLGIQAKKFYDIGVADLSRVLKVEKQLNKALAVIAIAGMEGALPTVINGLVRCQVVGVPTSVGYGVAKGGEVALKSMLSSCSPGLSVVNIDNGFGAACAVAKALRSRT